MRSEQWDNQLPTPVDSFERAQDFTVCVRIAFQQAIAAALDQASHLSAAMRKRLEERHEIGTLLAETAINQQQAFRLLEAIELEPHVMELEAHYGTALFQPGDALCVFRLPRVFREYRAYQEKAWAPEHERNALSDIDTLYYRGIEAIWTAARTYCQAHKVRLLRVNPVGIHRNTRFGYYYVFVLRPYKAHDQRHAELDQTRPVWH